MRLLYTASDGRFKWTEDLVVDKIPPYAILSHTWKEEQEVTFADLRELDNAAGVKAQNKEGYQKLLFCAQQAKQDSLDYFQVDTCYINKANNTELSKVINSISYQYQNAKRCYVFLLDVENNTLEGDGELVFRKSRWFNQGWTLQELLIGISFEALLGSNLSEFDVAKRFSWAVNWQILEEEDGAYCLFGIFGVHLPLIYSEGKANALKWLRNAAILKHKGCSYD